MASPIEKRLFKHGGSKAIDLPADVVKRLGSDTVRLEIREDGLFIPFDSSLDTMESDPQFAAFLEGVYRDAMENPQKLLDLEQVWDKEWDDLLEGVEVEEE